MTCTGGRLARFLKWRAFRPSPVMSTVRRTKMSNPSDASNAYRKMIDELVDEVRHFGGSSHVTSAKIYSKAPDHSHFNEFIGSLTDDQRQVLAQMLLVERDGAIHDVLAALSWWIDTHDLTMTIDGNELPVDQSGMGLHGDFVGRRDGWQWPDDA